MINFHALILDYARIYNLNFVALLEPHISGAKADEDIKNIGLDGGVHMKANGFAKGIWCLWKIDSLKVDLLSMSTSCVHLEIKSNFILSWIFTIIYASPHHRGTLTFGRSSEALSANIDKH